MHSHIMAFIAVSMPICFDALKREQAKTITHEEYIQSILGLAHKHETMLHKIAHTKFILT